MSEEYEKNEEMSVDLTETDGGSGEENANPNETRTEKFLRLAPPRVTKVIKALDTLGNCSGSGYEYTEEQIEKMFNAIDEAVKETKAKFEKKKPASKEFKF